MTILEGSYYPYSTESEAYRNYEMFPSQAITKWLRENLNSGQYDAKSGILMSAAMPRSLILVYGNGELLMAFKQRTYTI